MKELIEDLIKQGYLKTQVIIDAFNKINREDFVPADVKSDADANIPLPTFHGQTISQPLTVAFMLELLAPQKGEKILDVGSGSGWQTALLAEIVGKRGQIYAVERIEDLKKFGENNIKKYNFSNVKFICADGSKGLSEFAPYDKIITAAATPEIPVGLKEQLKIGGRLVLPVGDSHASQDIVLLEKISESSFAPAATKVMAGKKATADKDEFKETRYPGFVFVPLVEES